MRKLIAMLLALVMCLSLAAPTMAAMPTTMEELEKQASIKADSVYVEEAVTLYYYDGSVLGTSSGYNQIGADTQIQVTNIGSDADAYVLITQMAFVKNEKGQYALAQACSYDTFGCSWREGVMETPGFMSRALQVADENTGELLDTEKKLKVGESVVFHGSDLGCNDDVEVNEDTLFFIMACLVYEEGTAMYSKLFKVSDSAVPSDADPGNPFTDVPKDAYYHDPVLWALENGITQGTSKTTFGPTATCTRGQVATFLWRAKGKPEPKTTENPFKDVKESDYYYKAILWAYENGITQGTSKTTFDPNGTCTSAHVVTFLWRANGKPDAEAEGKEYYAKAVAWANANKLLDGTATLFAPENLSPRADIVTYLYRDMVK